MYTTFIQQKMECQAFSQNSLYFENKIIFNPICNLIFGVCICAAPNNFFLKKIIIKW